MIPGYRGKYQELVSKIYDEALGIDKDTEVELIVKPPEGFEDIMKPKKIELPPRPDGDEDMEDEEQEESRAIEDTKVPFWFQRKLKSILRDNAIQRHAGNKRSGDLDTKHLYKARTTGRVFTDKDVISKKTYSIALCVDCSGSMHRTKSELASICASKFVEQFQKLTNLSVLLFNGTIKVAKYPTKQLDEKAIKAMSSDICRMASSESLGAYGNHDAGVLYEASNLLKEQRGRKMIVIMSDGEPACSLHRHEKQHQEHKRTCYKNGSSASEQLKEAVHRVEGSGIPVLGIGIKASDVKEFYKQNIVVDELDQLYSNLIQLIQKNIRRGGI